MKTASGNSEKQYLFLYGSLRQGQTDFETLDLGQYLDFVGERSMKGYLYDLGAYPGVKLNPSEEEKKKGLKDEVKGELFEIRDKKVLTTLDAFERFDEENQKDSLYIRVEVDALGPDGAPAWTYEYNQPIGPKQQAVKGGDWLKHLRNREEKKASAEKRPLIERKA